jgi:2'-5' RNA ligase
MGEPRTAIVVTQPLPRSIASIRRTSVPVAALGVPPHVTILFPFLPPRALDDAVRGRLARIAAAHDAFDVRYALLGRFSDALYLEPEPDDPFRRLTIDISEAFPGFPPYGQPISQPSDVLPHLTIAIGDGAGFDALAARAIGDLPISGRVRTLTVLSEQRDGRWRTAWRLPLRP